MHNNRIFDLNLNDNRLDLLQELSFHNCCVLLVKVIVDPTGNPILLSAGTDGRLAVWDVSSVEEDATIDALGSLAIHQSGINCLDCKWVDVDRLLIVSGGDDNALTCSKMEINCQKGLLRLVDQQRQSPHAAQISGEFSYFENSLDF